MQTIRPDATTTRTPSTSHGVLPAVNGQTTVHGCMSGTVPVSADFTECIAGSRGGDVLVVALGDPGNTPNHDRNHIIRVCLSKNTSGGAVVGMICELRQSYVSETDLGTLVASFLCSDISATFGTYHRYRLTTGQAALITDYTALSLRFITTNARGGATRTTRLHWAEVELPENSESNVKDLKLSPTEAKRVRDGIAINQSVDRVAIGSSSPF